MRNQALEELVRLCPPPQSPVDTDEGNRLQDIKSRYGLVFPEEYVAFCRRYGTGGFVDANSREILIHNVFSRHYDERISYGQEVASYFFGDQPSRRALSDQGIQQESLFPLGRSTGVDFLYWVTHPDPDRWRVLLFYVEWEGWVDVFDCGVVEFLTGYFTGRLHVRIWESFLIDGRPPPYQFEPPPRR